MHDTVTNINKLLDKPKRKKSTRLKITERDVIILSFWDRVGYANIEQVTKFFKGDFSEAAILARIYVLNVD